MRLIHPLLRMVTVPPLPVVVSHTARVEIERRRLEMVDRCGPDLADRWADALITNHQLRFIYGIS